MYIIQEKCEGPDISNCTKHGLNKALEPHTKFLGRERNLGFIMIWKNTGISLSSGTSWYKSGILIICGPSCNQSD